MRVDFEELKVSGKLPSPPGVGMAILRLTQKEDYCIAEIAEAIQADPALAGRVIKLANSSKAATVNPIVNIEEAVKRLGVRTLKAIALGFSLISSYREGVCAAFDFEMFWSESLARAVSAQAVAAQRQLADPAEAYCCGLLAGVGRLALAWVYPDAYANVLAGIPDSNGAAGVAARLQGESEAFGLTSADVAESMLADWGFPAEYVEAIGDFCRGEVREGDGSPGRDGLVAALNLGQAIAGLCVAEGDAAPAWSELLAAAERLGVEPDAIRSLASEVASSWADWGAVLSLPTQPLPVFSEPPQSSDPKRAGGTEIPAVEGGLPKVSEREKCRVLAVDDERLSLKLIRHHLEKSGHDVLLASNGQEALEIAMREDPPIIVTDWRMPGMDGLDLVRMLRRYERGRATYIILLTGSDDEEQVVEAFDAGIDDYVTKPFNPRVLLARVGAGERVAHLQEQVAEDKRTLQKQMKELAILNRKLKTASITDPLTGLPNRRYAMERMQEAWGGRERQPKPMALVMIDIDHFKRVNDEYGHAAGDAVLQKVADVFREHIRHGDSICRIGGEEFLVILPQATLDEAATCAERMRAAVASAEVDAEGFSERVTVSLGVASSEQTDQSVDDLLNLADAAVYRAKAEGRNRVVLADIPVQT